MTHCMDARWNRCRVATRLAIGLFCVLGLRPIDGHAVECTDETPYAGPAPRAGDLQTLLPTARTDQPAHFEQSIAAEGSAALNREFRALLEKTGVPAASIAVWSPTHGYWSQSSGVREGASERFWWASVGKLVTGTLVLGLVEDGRLSLDDTIERWFPDYPLAAQITVDDLLLHRGGVFSFQADKTLDRRRGYKSPDTLLEVSAGHGPDFCPGSNWHYSNTGYLMLGLIVEAVEGESLSTLVDRHVARPLGLDSLRLVTADDNNDLIVPPAGNRQTEVREIASLAGAGAVVATAGDMLVLLDAVLTGRFYGNATRRKAFETLYPMFGSSMHYGRGVMLIDVPDPDLPTSWLGHVGGSEDSKAVLIHDTRRNTYVALVLNKAAPGEAIVNHLLKTLDELPTN